MTSSSRPWRAARYMAHRGARCLPVGSASVEARLGLEPWAGLSRAGFSAQPHPPRAGLLAADRKHWRPGGHPHALLHHRPLLLRWLQARASACQPHPGEQVLPARWAPRARPGLGPHRLTCCLVGSAGLLRGSHLRTLGQARTVHPHQLDGPRRQRVVLLLQRVGGALRTAHTPRGPLS